MKYTTNYIVYLNADNRVYSARCKITGRFVKRDLAQNEYELEYVYKVTLKGFISFMFTVFLVLLSFKQVKKVAKKIDQINSEMLLSFQQNDINKIKGFNKVNALQNEVYSLKFKA